MSIRSKTFIQLSDILSFRFECPQCHCSITIPVVGNIRNVPVNCPNGCSREWKEELNPRHGTKEAFDQVVEAMRELERRTSKIGVSLFLEIKEEPKQEEFPEETEEIAA